MLERIFLQMYIRLESMKNCIISILCDKSASAKIPKRILDELARCFLLDIIAYYETVEGREEYEAWGRLPKHSKCLSAQLRGRRAQ